MFCVLLMQFDVKCKKLLSDTLDGTENKLASFVVLEERCPCEGPDSNLLEKAQVSSRITKNAQ